MTLMTHRAGFVCVCDDTNDTQSWLLCLCVLMTLTTELTEPTLPAGDCCGDIGDGVPVVRLQLALLA